MATRTRRKSKRGGRRRATGRLSGSALQAYNEANLRYGTQERGLKRLLTEAGRTAKSRRGAARAGERGLLASLDRRTADVTAGANEQDRLNAQTAEMVRSRIAGLGSAADPLKAIVENTVSDATRRAGEARQRGTEALGAQRTAISRERASREAQIGSDLQTNVNEIGGRFADIAAEKGSFVASRIAELENEKRQRKHELRKIRVQERADLKKAIKLAGIEHEYDVDLLDRELAGGKYSGGKGGKKAKLTPDQQNKAIDSINEARTWIKRLSKNMSSTQIRQALQAGDELKDDNDNKLKLPKISKDYVNAAYDLHAFGYLSPANMRALRGRRVRIPKNWRTRRIRTDNPPRPKGKRRRKR